MATINLPTPSTDKIHGPKFFTVITLAVLALYAGYQGWISVSPLETLGGIGGLILLLGGVGILVWSANADQTWIHIVALIGASVLSVLVFLAVAFFRTLFSELSLQEVGTFIGGAAILVVTALWVSHKG